MSLTYERFNEIDTFPLSEAIAKAVLWNLDGNEVVSYGMKILTIDGENRSNIKADEITHYVRNRPGFSNIFYTKELLINGRLKGRMRMCVRFAATEHIPEITVGFSDSFTIGHTTPIDFGSQTKAAR